MQYALLKIGMKKHEKALKNADIVIANSKYIAGVVKKKYDVDCEVIYPFINLNEYKVEKLEPKYVTFFNPSIHKGGKIVLKIVKQMENIEFLVVGRGNVDFGKLPNVTQISWVKDVRKVYSKTKILLVPSLVSEAFGRVAVEAMINGIPCIVSNKGALPEVVGNSGIVIKNPMNINAWINAIKKLNSDNLLYQELCEKSIRQAKNFSFKKQYRKFKNILKRLMG